MSLFFLFYYPDTTMKTKTGKSASTKTIDNIISCSIAGNERMLTNLSQQHYLLIQNYDDMSKSKINVTKDKTDIYTQATNRVIELMKQGHVAWRRTWGTYGCAKNFATGRHYSGVNFLFMNYISPHPIPYYLTFRQVKHFGGKVKKGAKSEKVFFYKSYYKDENGKPLSKADLGLPKYKNQKIESIRFLRSYSVFNIEDTEGIEWEKPPEVSRNNNPIAECEMLIKSMSDKPTFELTDTRQAFYVPDLDVINVPPITQFENSEFYYRTTFHEIAHWTGAASRLSRPGITEKIERGSEKYAEEELVAELASNYILNIVGVDTTEVMEVSAGYLKTWVQRLKENPRMLFRVAPKAQAAVEYILGQPMKQLF